MVSNRPDSWRVLLPRQIHPAGPRSIADFAAFESVSDVGTDPAALERAIDRFDAIVLRTVPLTSTVIEAADRLRVIAKHGAGLDNVDIAAASRRGVVVCNTPGANARTVAEGTIALMLATRRNLVTADRDVRAGEWHAREDWDRYCRPTIEGAVLGLFGFGNVARHVASLATGLGMECLAYDPYVAGADLPTTTAKVESTGELFAEADVVSVHAPLTDETHGAIGAAELDRLGPDGILVNTARGGIVDEAALLGALRDGKLRGAGLDVRATEPPGADDPFREEPNVVLSPHIAGLSTEATRAMSSGAAAHVRTVYEGGLPETTVNADALEGHRR